MTNEEITKAEKYQKESLDMVRRAMGLPTIDEMFGKKKVPVSQVTEEGEKYDLDEEVLCGRPENHNNGNDECYYCKVLKYKV